MAVDKTLRKIILRDKMTELSHKRNICLSMPSEPLTLLGFNCKTKSVNSLALQFINQLIDNLI